MSYYHEYPAEPFENRGANYNNRRYKSRKSKSIVMDQGIYYDSPMYDNYGDYEGSNRHSSYIKDGAQFYNDYTFDQEGEHQSIRYRHEPITPETEYIPNVQEADYSYYAYNNDPQVTPDDAWTIDDTGEGEDLIVDDTTRENTQRNAEMQSYHSAETLDSSFPSPFQQAYNVTPVRSIEESLRPDKKKWYKRILNKGSLFNLKKSRKASMPKPSTPDVQVIAMNSHESFGDVLDSSQQKEIITQLYQSPKHTATDLVLPLEKQKITSLDRIWVFRLWTEEENEHIAWTGFDFDNQLKIEKHIQDLENRPEDGRLAIYDSHIRHNQMPVIVTPNDKKGYYFTDMHQKNLVMLEVASIQNDHQKVTFVYRV